MRIIIIRVCIALHVKLKKTKKIMVKEEILKLNLSGLDFNSIQEWIDVCEKKTDVDRHRFMQFCERKGYDVMCPISGTEFMTLLEEF